MNAKPKYAGKTHPVKSNQVSRGTISEAMAHDVHILRNPVKLQKKAEGKLKKK